MTKTLKTTDILAAYQLLSAALIKSMDNAGKFAVIRATKAMRAVATDFEDFEKDAVERLKDDDFNPMQQLAAQWEKEGKDTTLTDVQKAEVNAYFRAYAKNIEACCQVEAKKEHELDITPLTDDQFSALLADNEQWNVKQMVVIESVMCNN